MVEIAYFASVRGNDVQLLTRSSRRVGLRLAPRPHPVHRDSFRQFGRVRSGPRISIESILGEPMGARSIVASAVVLTMVAFAAAGCSRGPAIDARVTVNDHQLHVVCH